MNGLSRARRVLVQRARDELLAGAALAGDEHRGRRVGDALEHRVERRGSLGLSPMIPKRAVPRASARPASRVASAPARSRVRSALRDDGAHLALVERLGQVVERAGLQRLDRVVDGAVRGDHHDRQLGIVAQRCAQELHAVDLGHAQIGDHRDRCGAREERAAPARRPRRVCTS